MKLAGGAVLLAVVVAAAATLFMAEPSEAISCGEVNSLLSPCLSFVTRSSGGSPSGSCCANVGDLKARAPFPNDKRVVCQCITDQARRFQNPSSIMNRASQIPSFCRVDVSVPNNPNFDCNSIQ